MSILWYNNTSVLTKKIAENLKKSVKQSLIKKIQTEMNNLFKENKIIFKERSLNIHKPSGDKSADSDKLSEVPDVKASSNKSLNILAVFAAEKLTKKKENLLGKDLSKKVEIFLAKINQLPVGKTGKYRQLLFKEISLVNKKNILKKQQIIDNKIDQWGKDLEKEINMFFINKIKQPLSKTFQININTKKFSNAYLSRNPDQRTSMPIIEKSIYEFIESGKTLQNPSEHKYTYDTEINKVLILFVNGKPDQAKKKM